MGSPDLIFRQPSWVSHIWVVLRCFLKTAFRAATPEACLSESDEVDWALFRTLLYPHQTINLCVFFSCEALSLYFVSARSWAVWKVTLRRSFLEKIFCWERTDFQQQQETTTGVDERPVSDKPRFWNLKNFRSLESFHRKLPKLNFPIAYKSNVCCVILDGWAMYPINGWSVSYR